MEQSPLILASKSPRRKALLEQVGLKFTIEASDIDESNSQNLPPIKFVQYLSKKKAQKIANLHKDSIVIGADTMVVCNGEIFGKPKDSEEAKRILTNLSGKDHLVITGVTIVGKGSTITDFCQTTVRFKTLTSEEINRYVLTEEPMDKAGAYGIQEKGGIFVKEIVGDYSNVVGLPINILYEMLKKIGYNITDKWQLDRE